MPGTLPIIYSVPVQSRLLPSAQPTQFANFAACQVSVMTSTHSGSFVPLMYMDNAEQTAL